MFGVGENEKEVEEDSNTSNFKFLIWVNDNMSVSDLWKLTELYI
jgi:hypothetical protein